MNSPRLRAFPFLAAAALAFFPPTARALPFNSAFTTVVAHDDNRTRAGFSADERRDTALRATLTGDQPRVLGRDYLFTWGGELTGEAWRNYDRFNQTTLGARVSIRRRFGLGPSAPAARAELAGGPLFTRGDAREGWSGTAALGYSHRPIDGLRYGFGAELDRFDARNAFFSRTGHTVSAEVQAYLGPRWSLTLAARQRNGDVLSFAQASAVWRALNPYPTGVPSLRTDIFGEPLIAYKLDARTRAASATLALSLSVRRTLALAYDHAETRRDNLRYRVRTASIAFTQQF